MKGLICALFFIFITTDSIYSQELKKIPIKNTPVIDFAKDLEVRFIEIFPFVYFENKIDELIDSEKEKIINLLRDKDLGSCFNVEDEVLKDFCKFYISVNLLGVDSDDLDNLKDNFLLDLGKLAKSISFLKIGEFIKSEKFFNEVIDKSVTIFFYDLRDFYKEKDIDKIINSKKIGQLSKKAIVYKLLEDNSTLLSEKLKQYVNEHQYNFFTAINFFKKGNFSEAGKFFLNSSKKDDIKEIALYNAVYSFILDKNFKTASKLVPYLNSYDSKMFSLLLSVNNNAKNAFVYEDFVNDKDFWFLLKNIVRHKLEQDDSIGFLRDIKMNDIKGDEELLFYYCINLIINERHNFDNRCKNYNWKVQEYLSFFNDISDNNINKKESVRTIEGYKLYNYFPFSKLYGDFYFRNNKFEKAKKIYEDIIREGKNLKSDDLMNVYLLLSKIYKFNKSYFTAKKVVEEAIDKLSDKRDILRLEQLKILEEEENWDELLWRANAYLNETENDEIKKELQKFIEMCYERVDKLNKKEK